MRGGRFAASLAHSLAIHSLGSNFFGILVRFERHWFAITHNNSWTAALPRVLPAVVAGGHLHLVRGAAGQLGPGVRPNLAAGLGQHLQRRLV